MPEMLSPAVYCLLKKASPLYNYLKQVPVYKFLIWLFYIFGSFIYVVKRVVPATPSQFILIVIESLLTGTSLTDC